ncbi:MAG: hypothetical protein FJZ59_01405 [Chlamydiae bacterium]|nr:hypothetical protein [Chlamydiota bacterium]
METNLKKLLPIVGAFCLSMTNLVAAEYDSTKNSPPTQMAVPPSPTPGESGPNVILSADYTLWTARESGLAIAASNYYPTQGSTSSEEGKVYYPEMKLRSGFKVDLGVYLPHDNWDIQAQYTWFNNNNNGMHDADFTSGQAVSTFFGDAMTGPIRLSEASSSWNVWFNRIDLTMGRSFFAGHYLSVRPFMGLVGAWDNQKLHIDYTDSTGESNYDLHNTQKWWGIGAYGGMNATFTFVSDSSNQWSLFLDAGTALPWSKFKGTQSVENGNVEDSYLFTLHNTFYTVAPMLETALGIRWETWWADGSWMFLLQAAWEEQVWFNHNNFIVPGDATIGAGGGAYTMQGLTVKAAIAF